jgi:hypothetical protein
MWSMIGDLSESTETLRVKKSMPCNDSSPLFEKINQWLNARLTRNECLHLSPWPFPSHGANGDQYDRFAVAVVG